MALRNSTPRLLVLLLLLGAVSHASAGSIALSWNPVAYSDLAGYRIYYGTSAGNYTQQQDVGGVTGATVSGLTACTKYYLAVKGRDEDGDLSASFSTEISGFPRPVLSAAMPSTAERGVRSTLVLTGMNFVPGSTVSFSDPSITVNSVTIGSCAQLLVDVTVGSSAATGPVAIEVENPDRVYGSASGLLTINAPAPPSVVSVSPASASEDVSVAIRPTVTFSRVMLPSSIQPTTISLLDSTGNMVAQAAASPLLAADGKTATVVPADSLGTQATYRIRVLGGPSGVKAFTGGAMSSDYVQNPGFTTQDSYAGQPRILYASPFNRSIGVSVNAEPLLTFSEPMNRASLNRTNVAVLDLLGNAVAQASGSPVVSADGRSVTIQLADDLVHGAAYRLRVLGGDDGVRDTTGDPMATTFLQAPGFITALGLSDPPAVLSVLPADSANLVQVGVHPAVTFSEPMQATTLTPATVALLDAAGQPVEQRFGSPVLSSDGITVTIVPASPLQFSSYYRVRVTSGANGARDAAGDPLPQTFLQPVGFQTLADRAEGPRVTGIVPSSQSSGVPLGVRPIIFFSEPMDPASITPARVLLLDSSGRAVPQASDSPTIFPDGLRVRIVPASPLAYSATYRVRVLGGAPGVTDLTGDTLPATYTQASGFTTVPDQAAPVISSVSVAPEPVAAVVSWATTEPADGRVFYRRAVDVVYQQPVEDDLRMTSHSLRIFGLVPSVDYDFYLESTDVAGNRAASPEGHFTTLASPYAYLTIEAENSRLTSPVQTAIGPGAFGASWVDTPQFTQTGRATSPSGKCEISFYATVQGTWKVWSRIYSVSGGAGSWFESLDGGARRAISPSAAGAWQWVVSRSYVLSPGMHVFELGGLDDQARADRVVITNDPTFVATEQPASDTSQPPAPQGVTFTPGDRQGVLGWRNPASDAATIVIRYRTDGVYPASPADGFPVTSRAAAPDTADSYAHTGLLNGSVYFYSLFAIDESGNVSTPARGQVIPAP